MKNIIDYCVPHSIAMALKQKQFDEPCFAFYSEQKQLIIARGDCFQSKDNCPTAPTFEQVIDCMDENHKIRVDLTHADSNGNYKYTIWRWNYDNNVGKWEKVDYINSFYDKNERNKKAIEAALKLI
jgi:hypothetical protein